jgi:hypothetical protein
MRAGMFRLLRGRGVLAGSLIMGWLGGWIDLGCRGDELARAGELVGAGGAARG